MVLSFCLKFVTPLLIGGAEENSRGDEVGLTGKALRGCWRFWFRALAGGCLKHSDASAIADLENSIFGSTATSTFGLQVTAVPNRVRWIDQQLRLPHKTGMQAAPFRNAVAPGSVFRIRIVLRHSISRSAEDRRKEARRVEALLLTIWTWAHLGGIGNRARRGFGSPVICKSDDVTDAFTGFILSKKESALPLPEIQEYFTSSPELTELLRCGLKTVWGRFSDYVREQGYEVGGDIATDDRPIDRRFFVLSSLDQVSVSGMAFRSLDGNAGAISKVHGSRACADLGISERRNRWASPASIRFHVLKDDTGSEQFIPVLAWCHQKGISSSPGDLRDPAKLPQLRQFLTNDAGFGTTIKGTDLYEF